MFLIISAAHIVRQNASQGSISDCIAPSQLWFHQPSGVEAGEELIGN